MTRASVHAQLTSILAAALVGTGKPCKEVVGYKKDQIDKAPLVSILSAGSQRSYDSTNTLQVVHGFGVVVFVPDADAATGRTESNVEADLDAIDAIIEATVKANRGRNSYWESLDYSGEASSVDDIPVSGAPYVMETHMLLVTELE